MANPCLKCTRECPSKGCMEWQTWWRRNWDKNIHRKVTVGLTTQQVFRYEHPDDVRRAEREDSGDDGI